MARTKKAEHPVKAAFFGTNSLVVTDGKTTLLVDPYFTRPGKGKLLAGKVAPDAAKVRAALAEAGVKQADAVLITHAHVDHVLDAAEAARQTGATVYGSATAVLTARGHGLAPGKTRMAMQKERFSFGDFMVTFLPARHLPLPFPLSLVIGRGSRITRPFSPPARALSYKEGQSFHLLVDHPHGSFLNQGTAGLSPASTGNVSARVLLLGIGGLAARPRAYRKEWYEKSVCSTGAQRVWLTHWDDFSAPLSRPPRFMTGCDKVARELKDGDRARRVDLMPLKTWVPLFSGGPPETSLKG